MLSGMVQPLGISHVLLTENRVIDLPQDNLAREEPQIPEADPNQLVAAEPTQNVVEDVGHITDHIDLRN